MKQRLLIVTRRFWPLCDESCYRLLRWASNLQRGGVEVTVLTSRWHSSWPAESDCLEVKVVRLLPGPKSSWTETLFLRNIASWIVKHRHHFDAIYVDESESLLHQIGSRSVRDKIPLIARYAGIVQSFANGLQSLSAISQAVDGCRQADQVIAPNAMAHRQLQSSGVPAERIARIPDVSWSTMHYDPEIRRAAAESLRTINQDMLLPKDTKLLLYVGAFDENAGLEPLIKAAIAQLDKNRNFRLWLVGEGRAIANLHTIVKDAAQHHEILFHSVFDNLEELFQVADAIVCPSPRAGNEFILPTAIAAGIPIIALESSPYRNAMPSVLHPQLLKEATQPNFEIAIHDWLSDLARWQDRAEIARQEWVASNYIENAAKQWMELFKKCSNKSVAESKD
ncbi:MAG: glycosyltransferase family 4 protein [Pirellulaceae bacterium]|nr:glycosyltransferase family 4 protein [Pirellulaceae bacterium]